MRELKTLVEVAQAIEAGEKLQYRHTLEKNWYDAEYESCGILPMPTHHYRVAPKPVKIVEKVMYCRVWRQGNNPLWINTELFDTFEDARNGGSGPSTFLGTVKVVVDVEE